MGRFVVKLGPNQYVEWSSVVDAPVTNIMARHEMIQYLDHQDGARAFHENRERMKRADEHGTSCMAPTSRDDIIQFNRAGENEKCITLAQIKRRYKRKEDSNEKV